MNVTTLLFLNELIYSFPVRADSLLEVYTNKKLKVVAFMTRTLPSQKITTGFDLMSSGEW